MTQGEVKEPCVVYLAEVEYVARDPVLHTDPFGKPVGLVNIRIIKIEEQVNVAVSLGAICC